MFEKRKYRRKIFLHRIPNDQVVNAEILMNHDVAHIAHFTPRKLRMVLNKMIWGRTKIS